MPGVGTLAIMAGRGLLPRLIAEQRRAERRSYLVVAFRETAEDWIEEHPNEIHEFEKPGRLFAALRRADCRAVVFAGALQRPRLKLWRADVRAADLMPRIMGLMAEGDDGLLSGLADIFETEGFRVVGAQDCVAGLTCSPGVLGHRTPGERDRCDATKGAAILTALGEFDVGQAVVVAGGRCLGIEAAEGTDALLSRVAGLAGVQPPGGVLVKMAKPGQDRRFDLPTIGPGTVDGAARAGLSGLVIEAGAVLVLDRAATLARAESASLFLWSAARDALVP